MSPDEKMRPVMAPLDAGQHVLHTHAWLLANGFLPFSDADKGRTVEIQDGMFKINDAEQRVRWLGRASLADCSGRIVSVEPKFNGLVKLDSGIKVQLAFALSWSPSAFFWGRFRVLEPRHFTENLYHDSTGGTP